MKTNDFDEVDRQIKRLSAKINGHKAAKKRIEIQKLLKDAIQGCLDEGYDEYWLRTECFQMERNRWHEVKTSTNHEQRAEAQLMKIGETFRQIVELVGLPDDETDFENGAQVCGSLP